MDRYSRNMIKASVAKMLQTIGWHTIHTTPIEMLTDILIQYMTQMAKLTSDYCNEFGYVEPNLDHLGLVFREFHINLSDLEEYVTNVDFGPPVINVPKYPVPKENHLNFLKPGSKEVVTRPVHIHEHLPPMFSVQEASEAETEAPIKQEETDEANNNTADNSAAVFKRPIEVSPGETFKRPRLLMEEEGRPTREISSVIMTTSGYISPAREGKLPESRTPLAAIEVAPPPSNNIPTPATTTPKPKIVKKVEKKREKPGKELFKPFDDKIKKPAIMKDVAKLKQNKAITNVNNTGQLITNLINNDNVKVTPPSQSKALANRENKTLAAARLKTEKLNTTITPIPMKPTVAGSVIDNIDKLFTEPDKKKVNILKKISCVKNEKVDSKQKVKDEIKQESREGSPVLVIDEPIEPPKVHISNDITIELVGSSPVNKTSEKIEKAYCYDESPPGTPLTPKTPEISHSPPLTKARSKRKDKTKVKKVPKSNPSIINPDVEIDVDVRPKTPEAQLDKHVIMALGLAQYTPGLIPPPVNPFFPNMQLPLRFPGFGKPPFMPLVPPYPMDFQQPMMRPKEPNIPPPKPLIKDPPPPQILHPPPPVAPPIVVIDDAPLKPEKKAKEHKKEKKDKVKKKNKKDKIKDKAEKKKLKEEKKDKVKREKKEKKKEKEQLQSREIDSIPKLTLKLGSPAPNVESSDTRKLNIKPIVKKEEDPVPANTEQSREMSPELAKISALVTGQPKPKNPNNKEDSIKDEMPANNPASRAGCGPGRPRIHPIKPKAVKAPKQQPPQHQVPIKDSEGNEVWICPGCDKQDDGSPMIGCDDCDAWYHWVCVGIQVPPDDNENWYCRHCLAKKREVLQCDKKKKRKKREKKEH